MNSRMIRHNIRAYTRANISTLAWDAFLLAGLYMTVLFSHIIPFPLYKLEPMKIFLMLSIVYTSRGNALVMALTLPLVSTLSVGHPVFPKNLIIAAEMMVFTGILTALSLNRLGETGRFLLAILISKFVYYGIKAMVIEAGLLQMELFSTPFQTQLMAAGILAASFWLMRQGVKVQR